MHFGAKFRNFIRKTMSKVMKGHDGGTKGMSKKQNDGKCPKNPCQRLPTPLWLLENRQDSLIHNWACKRPPNPPLNNP
jgi:hypothetical protein